MKCIRPYRVTSAPGQRRGDLASNGDRDNTKIHANRASADLSDGDIDG
jgi:hypothetical protein